MGKTSKHPKSKRPKSLYKKTSKTSELGISRVFSANVDSDDNFDLNPVSTTEEVLSKCKGHSFSSMKNILDLEDVIEVTTQQRASMLLSCMLVVTSDEFYKSYWGCSPLYSESPDSERFSKISNKKFIDRTLQDHANVYNTDLSLMKFVECFDIYAATDTTVIEGIPSSISSRVQQPYTDGQAISAQQIWEMHSNGAVINLLCPQKYNDLIWKILSSLEHEFGTCVFSNILVVPGGSITITSARYNLFDSIILQSEGTSIVRLYRPLTSEQRDNYGAVVFVPAELSQQPYMTVTLSPGDSIYCPFGWAFQQEFTGISCVQVHFTTNNGNSVGSILDLVVPQALALVSSSKASQIPLPRDFFSIMGISRSEDDIEDAAYVGRKRLLSSVESLLKTVVDKALDMMDAASDQHVKSFILQRLPPPLSSREEKRSATGVPDLKIFPFSKLRMVRPGIARAVVEDSMVVVYHCMDNARIAEETVVQPLEFDLDDGPAIEVLLNAYPEGVEVSEIPHPSEELDDKVSVAVALYKEGFLIVEDEGTLPFEKVDGDSSNTDDPF
jgi:hypothetical protein